MALVVCSGSPFPVVSGGRKRVTRLLDTIQRAGVTPYVLMPHSLRPEDEPVARAEARQRGWPLEDVPAPRETTRSRLRQHLRQQSIPHSPLFARRVRELSSQALFAQFEEVGAFQYAPLVPRSIPTVVSPHNVDAEVYRAASREFPLGAARLRGAYRARRLRANERRAARRSDLCICVSDYDRDYYLARGARRVLVVGNGADDDLFELPVTPAPTQRVLFFGTYSWEANASGLVRFVREVWPRVVSVVPSAELRVAGSGPLERIRDAARETVRVQVLGFVEDLVAELRAARVVVAPIWFGGGTRIKVIEAIAAGRPVVGTSIGVERIGFEHDRHGLIADDPASMADATVRMLLDDRAAARMARNARELAHAYRWSELTAPLECYYRGLLVRATAGPSLAGFAQ